MAKLMLKASFGMATNLKQIFKALLHAPLRYIILKLDLIVGPENYDIYKRVLTQFHHYYQFY